jgi:hypothetical protein
VYVIRRIGITGGTVQSGVYETAKREGQLPGLACGDHSGTASPPCQAIPRSPVVVLVHRSVMRVRRTGADRRGGSAFGPSGAGLLDD